MESPNTCDVARILTQIFDIFAPQTSKIQSNEHFLFQFSFLLSSVSVFTRLYVIVVEFSLGTKDFST